MDSEFKWTGLFLLLIIDGIITLIIMNKTLICLVFNVLLYFTADAKAGEDVHEIGNVSIKIVAVPDADGYYKLSSDGSKGVFFFSSYQRIESCFIGSPDAKLVGVLLGGQLMICHTEDLTAELRTRRPVLILDWGEFVPYPKDRQLPLPAIGNRSKIEDVRWKDGHTIELSLCDTLPDLGPDAPKYSIMLDVSTGEVFCDIASQQRLLRCLRVNGCPPVLREKSSEKQKK